MDTYLHKGQRKILVDYLRDKVGIKNECVLNAINKVPRHLFMESIFQDYAYQDRAFPIASGQTISHPSTVAEQTELLDITPKQKVLEIGTGCGYQTSVLLAMGAKVYTIERQKELFDFSKNIFQRLGVSPTFQSFGDGFLGLPTFAPFDRILVTCGASTLPIELLKQLSIGGKMVIPLGEKEEYILHRFTKIEETHFEKETFGIYKFVPMLSGSNF